MPDQFANLVPQALPGTDVGDVAGSKLDLVNRVGLDIQQGKVLGRIINVDIVDELAHEVIVVPRDDVGAGKFASQAADQFNRDLSPSFGDAEINLQFFNATFQVRPFLSRLDGFWLLHPDLSGKGRPAGNCTTASYGSIAREA